MTLRLLVISLCLFSGIFASRAQTPHEMAEKALGELDRVLDRRSEYISQRQNAIDSLIEVWKQHPDDGCTLLKIADRYTSFNNDSALHYLRIGKKRYAGTTAGQEFRWKYASLLPLAGFYETAEKEFYSIRPDEIAKWQQASYLAAGTQMHSYIAASFRNYPEIVAAHTDSMTVLQRRLLDILPTDGNQYKFLLGEYYFMQGAHDRARPLLEETVDSEPVSSNLRARAAHHLSSIARADSIADLHIYYLALSATADVVSATRETISLQELGSACRDTNIRRAHSYLSNAMANAVECGASVRMIDTSQALPIIERAHSASIKSWRKTAYIVIAAMAVLMLVLIATLLLLRKEMRKMARLQDSLRNANRIKEVYISQFLRLCSIYMDKLNQFCKIATRKLAAGQADELYRMTKSGKFVEEQSHEFYEVFDHAFLHIYPDFVAEVNKLLRPDQQIELRDGELMNTDLRILAFMRLGIQESARIAQVLNYSLNTIYNYRNRLKAKARDKDNFESQIMKIGS